MRRNTSRSWAATQHKDALLFGFRRPCAAHVGVLPALGINDWLAAKVALRLLVHAWLLLLRCLFFLSFLGLCPAGRAVIDV